MGDAVPQLVEPDWLEARLDDPDLRILDCTVHLDFDADGDRHTEPARTAWERAHVPGSVYADLVTDLSDTSEGSSPFERPAADEFAAAMERLGVGDDTRVVCYDNDVNEWAARVWWLLRSYGFDDVGVLNGGWTRWVAEGRPVSSGEPEVPAATFTPDPRPGRVVDKATVADRLDDPDTRIVNGLRPDDHAGTGRPIKYGRPGRIPGSVNVPAHGDCGIVRDDLETYRDRDALEAQFDAAGATDADRVITYCGGGIAASSVAFALELVGHDDVAVYDRSLSEWGRDESLPMETD
jgi:thiosulfate/3-mercaptopyruvate sulfurtransferase